MPGPITGGPGQRSARKLRSSRACAHSRSDGESAADNVVRIPPAPVTQREAALPDASLNTAAVTTYDPRSRRPMPETAVGVLLAVLAMGLVAYWARGMDFVSDDWNFLATRDLADPISLLRPYTGHLSLTAATVFAGMRELVGFDYWPWWYLPRLIAHAALGLLLWRVWLRRGADRVIAFGAFGLFLVLGLSYFQKPSGIGNYVSLAVAVTAAWLIASEDHPSWPRRAALAGCLVVGFASSSLTIATTLALFLVLLLTGRLARWWSSLFIAIILYGAWFWYARSGEMLAGRFGAVTETLAVEPLAFLSAGVDLVVRTLPGLLGVPLAVGGRPTNITAIGVVLALALAVWLGFLIVRRRLGRYEATLLLAALLYLGMVVGNRILVHEELVGRAQYQFTLATLLLGALVPTIRLPRGIPVRVLVAIGFGAILIGNLISLQSGLHDMGRRAASSRVIAETAGEMVIVGEPVASRSAKLGVPVLNVNLLEQVIERGFPHQLHPEAERRVRSLLRIAVLPDSTDTTKQEADCIPVTREIRRTSVTGNTLTIRTPTGTRLLATSTDEFGFGRRVIAAPEDRFRLQFAPAKDSMTWSLNPAGTETIVCGLNRLPWNGLRAS
jgi:hypothetical protein